MKIKNTFTSGKMNKDVDERLIPNGEYRDALNVRIANSDGSDVGAIENSLSNVAKSSLDLGANPVTLGVATDHEARRIYWFVKSDSGSYICEYAKESDISSIVMQETTSHGVLNFSKNIQADILTDIDNNKKFLYFTDGVNPPRKINIDTAKGYAIDGFTNDDISVIVKPPINPPSISMVESLSSFKNNIKDKMLLFSYRYKYVDGQYSAIAPFSKVAFGPKSFSFDYATATNQSMENKYSSVDVTFNTGSDLVESVQLLFKESDLNIVYAVETFNKANKQWGDDSDQTVRFDNSKIYKTLPEDEIFRLYDNVPKTAKTQEIIGNRLVYGNYTENYNLVDASGSNINIGLSLSQVLEPIVIGTPTETVRSNRDYEVGIVYLDEYGRSSTVITSEGNDIHVPLNAATSKNSLKLAISGVAPDFAKFFRIFIKQSRTEYDSIVPVVFYRGKADDYIYIKIQGDDANKIKEGDFVVIKTDTTGLKTSVVEAKVLEVKLQDRNFLETTTVTELKQESGVYVKLKESGFRMNPSDFDLFEMSSFDQPWISEEYPLLNLDTPSYRYDGPFYYGDNDSNDIVVSGTFSGTEFMRLTISISQVGDGITTFDKFEYQFDSFGQGADSSDTDIQITPGTPVSIGNGLSIDFGSNVGHSALSDRWTVNCKIPQLSLPNQYLQDFHRHAYGIFAFSDTVEEENITAASFLTIFLRDKIQSAYSSTLDNGYPVNANYANIEEWFHEEGRALIEADYDLPNLSMNNWKFYRGTYDGTSLTVTGSQSDPMHMVYESGGYGTSAQSINPSVETSIGVSKKTTSTNLVIETQPIQADTDIYYELPRTYTVDSNGYHIGYDTNDTSQTTPTESAEIILPFFNAFSWGNGIESYKIKDSFLGTKLTINTRPLTTVLDYKENKRTSSITYSDVYEQSTGYNGLNEFNLANVNYVDLDDEYGSIQKIYSRDTNLIVFQENKVSQLLYNKSVLYNADGTGNVSQTKNVFGQQVPYAGEYGISSSPQSFAFWGERIYFADEKRRSVNRLSRDGITEISSYGMDNWFKTNINTDTKIVGGYDPYNDQYVLSIKEPVVTWAIGTEICVDVSSYINSVHLSTSKELLAQGVMLDPLTAQSIWITVDGEGTFYVKYDALVSDGVNPDITFSLATPITMSSPQAFNYTWAAGYSGGTVKITTHVCDTAFGQYVPYNVIEEYIP